MNSSDSLTITERLEAALAYAQVRGWKVFPCHTFVDGGCTCEDANCGSKAKHPLTPNGCKDATTDPADDHQLVGRDGRIPQRRHRHGSRVRYRGRGRGHLLGRHGLAG